MNCPIDEDEETRILLEKEFDDYYEDHVHKSAGPVVFVSKMLGMIPVIWTEDEEESECKSYFNLYTFVIFIGIMKILKQFLVQSMVVTENKQSKCNDHICLK